jgi:hypothetical protein
MVPPPIITHFLEGAKRDGPNYKGFPDLGVLVRLSLLSSFHS